MAQAETSMAPKKTRTPKKKLVPKAAKPVRAKAAAKRPAEAKARSTAKTRGANVAKAAPKPPTKPPAKAPAKPARPDPMPKVRPVAAEKPGKAAAPAKPAKASKPPPSSKAERPAKERREVAVAAVQPREPVRVLPLPVLAPVKRPSIEERAEGIEKRLNEQPEEFRRRYIESFDMSWIYHDSALEGVVYTFDELRAALGGQSPPPGESGIQPATEDIRRHKEAIDFVRDFATKKRLPVTVDVIKKVYLILHPEEGDIKTVKYRKDVPQHRLYFHEYAAPDKIAYKVRQVVDWLNDPETKKTRNGIRIAARAHYDLLRVYPFSVDSGKVSRLFMNLLLMRSGLPPSIIHSTERQRYYDALKGSATTVLQMVQESVENALSSVEKLLDEHETRMRAFVS